MNTPKQKCLLTADIFSGIALGEKSPAFFRLHIVRLRNSFFDMLFRQSEAGCLCILPLKPSFRVKSRWGSGLFRIRSFCAMRAAAEVFCWCFPLNE